MTENEVLKTLEDLQRLLTNYRHISTELTEANGIAIQALEEIQAYRAIGTVEELQNAVMEEDVLKFYYCESEDSYLLGIRVDNFYYAHWDGKRFVFDMSRYLPWGKHVVAPETAWKEHTYPTEPKEIDFSTWLQGFIKKECGGTIEELQALKEKAEPKKPRLIVNAMICPSCPKVYSNDRVTYRLNCGQKLDWD